jgi:hypothetical protein
MKKEKLNLKSIKNVLSRSEMKKVMAGSWGTVLCSCNGGRTAGYCLCQTMADCIECCDVACYG